MCPKWPFLMIISEIRRKYGEVPESTEKVRRFGKYGDSYGDLEKVRRSPYKVRSVATLNWIRIEARVLGR